MRLPPIALAAIYKNGCPTCDKPIGEFKDELSRREFRISGMCQACQDSVFEPDDEPDPDCELCGCHE